MIYKPSHLTDIQQFISDIHNIGVIQDDMLKNYCLSGELLKEFTVLLMLTWKLSKYVIG